MSSKHILGIGQHEPGKVAIIHGNSLQCDHEVPIMQDCFRCLKAALVDAEVKHAPINTLWGNLATKTAFWKDGLE